MPCLVRVNSTVCEYLAKAGQRKLNRREEMLRTSITLGLRIIPPSAGLSREPLHKVARHISRQPKYLSVIQDDELDKEIQAWKEQHDK